jgi:hypothetical protein
VSVASRSTPPSRPIWQVRLTIGNKPHVPAGVRPEKMVALNTAGGGYVTKRTLRLMTSSLRLIKENYWIVGIVRKCGQAATTKFVCTVKA